MSYTLDGITLEAKRTPSGVGYWQYGADNLPTIVYLHGAGEKGDGSEPFLMKLLGQGPLRRNDTQTGWRYKEVFNYGFRILYPQLPTTKGSWDVSYLDSFLDAMHTNQPLFIAGWSLGGGGALRYAAQVTKKHKLTCFAGIASAISPIVGAYVDSPYHLTHAINDATVNVSHTDNYVAKIPNLDSTKYFRGTSGDHWYMVKELWDRPMIYDWFKSLVTIPPVVETTYTQGIIELGSDGLIYGNFNGNRIQLT